MYETQHETARPRAALVGLDTGEYDALESLKELALLAETADCEVISVTLQNRPAPDTATCIGAGKLAELCDTVNAEEIDLVIFDLELTGMQIRNLSDRLDRKVIDRTMLILDIFARRARTREGQVQVSLAQYQYRLSRLTGMGNALSRLGGGIGTRGPGETKLETDRRHIRSRIQSLKRELAEMEQHMQYIGKRRKKDGILTVAVVGYTNAGKSTLFHALTAADVLMEDKLFATLDVTARGLDLPDGRRVLLSDTVGLIRRLPHHLVEAFRSTLREAADADLILHVLDASETDIRARMDVTTDLLADLGCADIPQVRVMNKADLCSSIGENTDEQVWICAKDNTGLDVLLETIAKRLPETAKRMRLCIPYAEGGFLQTLREEGTVFAEFYTDSGVLVDVLVDVRRLKQAAAYLTDAPIPEPET